MFRRTDQDSRSLWLNSYGEFSVLDDGHDFCEDAVTHRAEMKLAVFVLFDSFDYFLNQLAKKGDSPKNYLNHEYMVTNYNHHSE